MPDSTVVKTDKSPTKNLHIYSQARWAGPFLYLSGQLGLDPVTDQLVDDGVAGQTRQAMTNMGEVLAAAGLDWSRVVKVNIYLDDIRDYPAFNDVYLDMLPEQSPRPARTCVAVKGIPLAAKVEMEAIAFSPERAGH